MKASDVNATKNRFSVRFSENKSYGSDFLLTGDEVRIERTDGGVLDLVTSNTAKGTKKFIYVDQVGGIRLYNTFNEAVTGSSSNAVSLSTPSSDYEVQIKVSRRVGS